MQKLAILGSTGSIGRQTLEVAQHLGDRMRVVAIGCAVRKELLLQQQRQFAVPHIIMPVWQGDAPNHVTVWNGPDCMQRYAQEGDYDILVVAVTGIAGLLPTLAALRRGKRVALANKETLVCGGELVMRTAAEYGAELLPIDSEHCALHQCIAQAGTSVHRLYITASGGALRDMPKEETAHATVAQVLSHPNWQMGGKITVDCATMVNKAFEIVEAHYLFGIPLTDITAVLHRQSVVHGLAEFVDGSIVAQMAVADMRLPIQYALTYPNRFPSLACPLSPVGLHLDFDAIDSDRYPCYALGLQCARAGSRALIAYNAADEVAVQAFLAGHISFGDIHTILCRTVQGLTGHCADIEDILAVDQMARMRAKEWI